MRSKDFIRGMRKYYSDITGHVDLESRLEKLDRIFDRAVILSHEFKFDIHIQSIAIMVYTHNLFEHNFQSNYRTLGRYHLLTTKEWFVEDKPKRLITLLSMVVSEHNTDHNNEYYSKYSELLNIASSGVSIPILEIFEELINVSYYDLKKSENESITLAFEYCKEFTLNMSNNKRLIRYSNIYNGLIERNMETLSKLTMDDAKSMLKHV